MHKVSESLRWFGNLTPKNQKMEIGKKVSAKKIIQILIGIFFQKKKPQRRRGLPNICTTFSLFSGIGCSSKQFSMSKLRTKDGNFLIKES